VDSPKRSDAPFPARRALSWATFSCLLLLSTACAPPATLVVRPDPPPPALAANCWPGPEWPAGDAPLADVLEVAAERERATAKCRARHRGLVKWSRAVSR
jgi:hypothetical protein